MNPSSVKNFPSIPECRKRLAHAMKTNAWHLFLPSKQRFSPPLKVPSDYESFVAYCEVLFTSIEVARQYIPLERYSEGRLLIDYSSVQDPSCLTKDQGILHKITIPDISEVHLFAALYCWLTDSVDSLPIDSYSKEELSSMNFGLYLSYPNFIFQITSYVFSSVEQRYALAIESIGQAKIKEINLKAITLATDLNLRSHG